MFQINFEIFALVHFHDRFEESIFWRCPFVLQNMLSKIDKTATKVDIWEPCGWGLLFTCSVYSSVTCLTCLHVEKCMEIESTQIKLLALSTSYLATFKAMIVCYARMKNHVLNQIASLCRNWKDVNI